MLSLSDRSFSRTIALSIILASAAIVPRAALAQVHPSEPVSIYVTVEQGDKLIRGLTHQDFRLFQDGSPRQFQLEPPERPISIALLIEFSRASGLYFNDIHAAVSAFLKSAPQGDWIALAVFSKDLEIPVDFTKERGELEDGLAGLGSPKWSEIDTYDAVYGMLEKMRALKGRRVLILIGSGLNTMSKHHLDQVRRMAQSSNVTIYSAGAGSLLRGHYSARLSSAQQMHLTQAESFMRMLADETGGEAWFPRFESAYAGVVQGVLQSIDSQYRLVYSPQIPQDNKFHKIKVEAFRVQNDKRQNFKVRARAGWRF